MSKLLAVLSLANCIKGSTTDNVCEFTVVVVPLTVKSPAIVTSRPVVKSPFLEIIKAVVSKAFASDVLTTIDSVTAAWSIYKSPVKLFAIKLLARQQLVKICKIIFLAVFF